MEYQVRCSADGVVDVLAITAATEDDAIAEAETVCESWLSDGDWDTADGTIWPRAHWVLLLRETEIAEGDVRITLDPDEPSCHRGHEHVWAARPFAVGYVENLGVHGHGGGVVITEACTRCGAYRTTDTWATDPATGEDGLRSMVYGDADDESLGWIDERDRQLLERVERLGATTAREAIEQGWDSSEDYELTEHDTDAIEAIARDLGDPMADDGYLFTCEGREVIRAFYTGVERVAADAALDAEEGEEEVDA